MPTADSVVQNNPLLVPTDVNFTLFSNRPIICQISELLAHIVTALEVSARENKQVDLRVHVNNKSNSRLGILIGEDQLPGIHRSVDHYIGDGNGV